MATITIGIVDVARFAAMTLELVEATRTSTLARTRSWYTSEADHGEARRHDMTASLDQRRALLTAALGFMQLIRWREPKSHPR